MKMLRVWRLRSYLAALLVVTILATFAIVGSGILLLRIPKIEADNKDEVERNTHEIADRVEILLGSLEARMALISEAVENRDLVEATAVLERAAWDGKAIRAIYLASNEGTVLAAGVVPALRERRTDLLGSDLSASPLFRSVLASRQMVWGDKFLSALSGAVTVGLAYPVGRDRLLLAEVPLSYLLDTFQLAAGQRTASIWLVDRSGEIVADTDGGQHVGTMNVLNWPLMQAARNFQTLPEVFRFEGRSFHPAVAHSQALDWYFVGGMPAGLENQDIRGLVVLVVGGFAGALLVGLVLAPFWASWLTRPLRRIVARAGQITQGAAGGPWPRGAILEFNYLSADLERMARTLQERELKSQAIFNASPVPMSVTHTESPYALLDVNEAWCRGFGRTREAVLGRTASEIGLWRSQEERSAMLDGLQQGQAVVEAWMLRGDGVAVLFQLSRRQAQVGNSFLMVWAAVEMTHIRRISNELRELNTELEARVQRRTQALAAANEELSGAVAHLRDAQGELVRAEKMAALGGLVAGVAHELNTPLGNSLMAVTTLTDEVRQFRAAMHTGLRRSALDNLLDSVDQATDIAARNLHRAADLVTSFKQVAVDQTSSQRRHFELREVVDEMVVSLRPSFARTPYKILVDVPTGLRLDSYPGALGQAIGNLIHNAVLHGFDGRDHGTVRITGGRDDQGVVVLRVADDGHGISPDLLDRIFDPFFTTKMGRGGTGLGLHITYNVVSNVLGGGLSVRSTPGSGTCFEMRLPDMAPRTSGPASLD
ncbi:adaptive-response sensory-kinase SasA [Comamonadaceae bacterium OS-1]|nr:adaptive-response sensory-kinase SasA [Comamonadaceae bacterium OS-1]